MVQEVEAVLEALKQRGHRMTPQRIAIIRAIMRTEGHISPQRVAAEVKTEMPAVNASTVYRNLDLLEAIGVVSHSHLGEGAEYHLATRSDHVHLLCRRCKKKTSLPVGRLDGATDRFTAAAGFTPDFTHFAVSGTCAACSSDQDPSTG